MQPYTLNPKFCRMSFGSLERRPRPGIQTLVDYVDAMLALYTTFAGIFSQTLGILILVLGTIRYETHKVLEHYMEFQLGTEMCVNIRVG